jgi:hypothetical protein
MLLWSILFLLTEARRERGNCVEVQPNQYRIISWRDWRTGGGFLLNINLAADTGNGYLTVSYIEKSQHSSEVSFCYKNYFFNKIDNILCGA